MAEGLAGGESQIFEGALIPWAGVALIALGCG